MAQIVTAPVVFRFRTGWTSRDIVPPNLSYFPHAVQNAEFRPTVSVLSSHRDVPRKACGQFGLGTLFACDELSQLLLGDLPETVEVLGFQGVISAIKPKSAIGATVDSQRTPDGAAELSRAYGVVLGKHLDAVGKTHAFHRNAQLHGQIVDINSAFSGQQRRCQEDPKMPTASAHLQRRLHSVLCQVVLQLQQVLNGVLVVSVDGEPFTALGGRVDSVKAGRDFAFQVLADGFVRQHHGYVGSSLAWPELIVPPGFRVRPDGLHRVRAAVHEKPLVILDDLPGCPDCRCH